MREDAEMRCEAAREALSARLDGEPHDVPTQRVDAHLGSCAECRAWLLGVAMQTRRLATVEVGHGPDLAEKIMATAGIAATAPHHRWLHRLVSNYRRWALIAVGLFQVAVASAQIAGIDFGLVSTHGHGAATGMHLLHESTAWLLALGLAMITAGIWTAAATGVAAIATAFTAALLTYVAIDAYHSEVTAARIASHLPLLVGVVFAWLVARERAGATKPNTTGDAQAVDPVPPVAVARSRRRGHLWPINRSAA
jgi:predicted anti-sigma-YlaC factor YlaD